MTRIHTRAPSLSAQGHRAMIAPTVSHLPFTEAAIANHARRLRAQLERLGR